MARYWSFSSTFPNCIGTCILTDPSNISFKAFSYYSNGKAWYWHFWLFSKTLWCWSNYSNLIKYIYNNQFSKRLRNPELLTNAFTNAALLFMMVSYTFINSKTWEIFSCEKQNDGTWTLQPSPCMFIFILFSLTFHSKQLLWCWLECNDSRCCHINYSLYNWNPCFICVSRIQK